jgi:hypothetical protein
MDGLKRTLALAAFEMRQTLRMKRVWILGLVAMIFPGFMLAQLFAIHRFFSGFNGSWTTVTRDIVVLQPAIFLGAALGLVNVFTVFDWRQRDVARQFAASLDASPLTRLQHAWGKFLGMLPGLVGPLVVLVFVQAALTIPFGVFAPWRTYTDIYLLLAVPFAVTPAAMAFGLAGLFRNQALGRTIGIVAGLAWLGVGFGAGLALAEKHAVMLGALVDMPVWSDWTGYPWSALTILQRLWAYLVAALFVSLASFGPLGLTESGRERIRRASIVGGLAVAVAGLSALAGFAYRAQSQRAQQLVDAEVRAASQPHLTVVRREADVDLRSAPRVTATTRLTLRNQTSSPASSITLRLNPGLDVTSARVNGAPATASRDEGVVTLAAPLAAGAEASVEITASGRLDVGAVDPRTTLQVREASATVRNNARLIGNQPAILTGRIAVLPQDAGIIADTAFVQGVVAPDRAFPDLAPSKLKVTLPGGWTAAATGRREGAGSELTFTSDEPLSGIALCAARFEEKDLVVGGTTFRLFYHRKHARNVEFFASAKDRLGAALADRIADLRARTGLEPPAELSVVDVPQLYATYGGTWDGPNRLGQPGLVLVKEGSFFGARFEMALKVAKPEAGAKAAAGSSGAGGPSGATGAPAPKGESEFDPERAKVEILQRFFITDFTGGSVPRLAMRSAWVARVQPEGEGLAILGPALSSFVAETALGSFVVDTAESARILNDNRVISGVVQAMIAKDDSRIPDIVMRAIADPDDAYAMMTTVPLEKMDPIAKPREWAGVLYTKGRRPLLALRELLGSSGFAHAIGSLAGRPLTWAAFREAILANAPPEAVPQAGVLLDNWLSGTNLPGFVVEKVRAFRVQAEPERWQFVATIRNDGTADGVARLSVGSANDAIPRLVSIPVGGRVEAGILGPRALKEWRLEPFLALNKASPGGTIATESAAPADWMELDGVRDAPAPASAAVVVVDNLDAGFTVTDKTEVVAYSARNATGDPLLGKWTGYDSPGRWRRWRFDNTRSRPYGAFDETAAVKAGAKGKQPATWTATLPAGTWRVEAYLPASETGPGRRGRPTYSEQFTFVVVHDGREETVKLALPKDQPGWSDLGRFAFSGPVVVRLLDEGKGLVVADAVRFTREGP